MNGKLQGKVAVVTGGSSGIGFAAAKVFAQEGANVYITGRRKTALDAAAAAIGSGVVALQADASRISGIESVYERVAKDHGRVDILYANAGFYEFGHIRDLTEAHYDKTFDTNVKGLVFSVQKVLPLMKNGGSIIMTGSIAGSKGMEAFGVYSATKAAVRSFARSWTSDLKGTGIRVNVISPGPIDTPGLGTLAPSPDHVDGLKRNLASIIPMGRLGTSDEVAQAALFLASDDASFVTGIELFVDGGSGQV